MTTLFAVTGDGHIYRPVTVCALFAPNYLSPGTIVAPKQDAYGKEAMEKESLNM